MFIVLDLDFFFFKVQATPELYYFFLLQTTYTPLFQSNF